MCRVCTCVSLCVHMHTCVYTHSHMYACSHVVYVVVWLVGVTEYEHGCLYVEVHVWMSMSLYMHVHLWTPVHICLYMCIGIQLSVCVYMYVCVWRHLCVCIVSVCIYANMYVCPSLQMCLCAYTCLCAPLYMYILHVWTCEHMSAFMCECVQASLCGYSVPVYVHIWVCISGCIYALCTCTPAHICMIVDISVFKCVHTCGHLWFASFIIFFRGKERRSLCRGENRCESGGKDAWSRTMLRG